MLRLLLVSFILILTNWPAVFFFISIQSGKHGNGVEVAGILLFSLIRIYYNIHVDWRLFFTASI